MFSLMIAITIDCKCVLSINAAYTPVSQKRISGDKNTTLRGCGRVFDLIISSESDIVYLFSRVRVLKNSATECNNRGQWINVEISRMPVEGALKVFLK